MIELISGLLIRSLLDISIILRVLLWSALTRNGKYYGKSFEILGKSYDTGSDGKYSEYFYSE